MKLDITVTATGECDLEIALYDGEMLLEMIRCITLPGAETFNIEHDFVAGKKYRLEIGRHETDLYQTDRTFHEHQLIISSVLLDEFWKLTDNRTHYDKEYVDFVQDRATWELTNDKFNDTIHFNGSLIYEITTPARGMFFK
jgi:hypothetical protein